GPQAVGYLIPAMSIASPLMRLQCGHGPQAVGYQAEAGGVGHHSPASMRPRPSGRGIPSSTALDQPSDTQASMRPRPSGRGIHNNTIALKRIFRQLQCGHGPQAVGYWYPEPRFEFGPM